ncbi:MAG: ABC transporter substrate-binding protein, partial [Halanaerobiales bacterium]
GNQNTLDPHYAYDTGSTEIVYNVYENLIAYQGESVTEFVPLLATQVPSVENGLIKDDGTTYIFPIREGVEFSNGYPLTPEDVKYSFLRAMINDRSGGPIWMLYEPLLGMGGLQDLVTEVLGEDISPSKLTSEQSAQVYAELEKVIEIDGNSVIFHLQEGPYPPFLNILAHGASWGAIIDKEWSIKQGAWDGSPDSIAEYYDPTKEDDPLFDKMMGTGPFILTEWVNGDHVYLKRNDNYWREPANFKTVVFKTIDEFSTRKLLLVRGDADMIYVPNQFLSQVEEMDEVTVIKDLPSQENMTGLMNWEITTKGNEYVGSGQLDGEGIPSKFFADKDVRMGFIKAFNYEAFINDIRLGNSYQSGGPIVRPLLGTSSDQPVYSQDLEAAEEHFKNAFDGEIWEKGFQMTLLYNTGNAARQAACDILKTYVEGINPKFNIDIRGVQWSSYLDAQLQGKFTIGFMGWLGDFPDPHNWVTPYLSSTGTFGGWKGEAYTEWAKDNFDPIIKDGITTVDQKEREEIYENLQSMAFEEGTDLWLDQPTAHNVRRDWVKGWFPNPMRPGLDAYILDKE